jgi:hypothetical protein
MKKSNRRKAYGFSMKKRQYRKIKESGPEKDPALTSGKRGQGWRE